MDKNKIKQHEEVNDLSFSTNDVPVNNTGESPGENKKYNEGIDGKELSALSDQINHKFDELNNHISQINKRMKSIEFIVKDKLEKDIYTDKINERLHKELQDYKNDLLSKMTQPLINDFISFYDDLDNYLSFYQSKKEKLTPDQGLSLLTELKNYILDILEKHDVLSFQDESDQFDPKTQRALKTINTHNPEKIKHVSRHIKPGFKRHGKIIRSEGVEIYKYSSDEKLTSESEINNVETSKIKP